MLECCTRPKTQKKSSRRGPCRPPRFLMILLLITSSCQWTRVSSVTSSFPFFSTIIAKATSGSVPMECYPWPRAFPATVASAPWIATPTVADIRLSSLHTLSTSWKLCLSLHCCRILRKERMPRLCTATRTTRLLSNGKPFRRSETHFSHSPSNSCFVLTGVWSMCTRRWSQLCQFIVDHHPSSSDILLQGLHWSASILLHVQSDRPQSIPQHQCSRVVGEGVWS